MRVSVRVGQEQREGRGVVSVGERKSDLGIRPSPKLKIIHFINLGGSI